MKAAPQRSRRPPPPVRAVRSALRTGRSEAHERQADRIAEQFIRGEHGLARAITPAPGAAFVLPTSPGVPLPHPLRNDLEQAFGANLSAIRVHHDAHAAQAASQAGAMAFASGVDLYFATNAFDPHSQSGRALLAHEVAHVLQQTARMGSGGTLVAVNRHGPGAVQCWASPIDSTTNVPEIPELLAKHRDELDSTHAARPAIERLLRQYPVTDLTARGTWLEERARHVREDSVDPVLGERPTLVAAPAASALYDLLKRAHLYGAAALLLSERRDLQTFFFSAETYQQYMDDYAAEDFSVAKARFQHHWYTARWFGNANPRFILDRTLVTLLGLRTRVTDQPVASGQTLLQAHSEERKRIDSGELLPDELYFVAVQVAGDVETLRVALLAHVVQEIARLKGYDPELGPEIKANMAKLLKEQIADQRRSRAAVLAKTEGANRAPFSREGMLVWFDDMLPALDKMADYALSFWESAAQFTTSLQKDLPIEGLQEKAAPLLRKIDTEIPKYRGTLETFFHALLDREPDGRVSDPAAFAARRDRAVRQLDAALFADVERALADRLIDAMPSIREEESFSFDSAMADRRVPPPTRALIAWCLTLTDRLRKVARSYSQAEDERLVARQRLVDPQALAADLRHRVRLQLARHLVALGTGAGWHAWVDWGRSILEAREIVNGKEMERDYVAFGREWELDENAPVGQMVHDLPPMPADFEPLSTRDLVELYLALDYRSLTGHIDRLLGARGTRYDVTDVPILNEALAATRAEHRPHRYVLRDWDWAGMEGAPRQPVKELVWNHPLTRLRIEEERARSPQVLVSVNAPVIGRRPMFVMWTAPSPVALVERLKAIPAVNQALLTALAQHPLGGGLGEEDAAAAATLREKIETGAGFEANTVGGQTPQPGKLERFTPAQLQALRWDIWWDLWQTVLAGLSGPERAVLVKLMRAAMEQAGLPAALVRERKAAAEQARGAEHQAIIHERRRLVEVQWRPTMQNFQPNGWDKYAIPGESVLYQRLLASETARLIERFMVQLPSEGREAHHAIALLELSDTLEERLGSLNEPKEFYKWGRLIDQALLWANDPERGGKRTLRDSYMVENERGDDTLFDTRRARLTALLTHMSLVIQKHYEKWGIVAIAGDGTIENPGMIHALDKEHRKVGRGTVIANEGRTFEVVQVHKSFTFHPGAMRFKSLPAQATGGTRLKIGNVDYPDESKRPKELLMHVIIDGGPEVTPVYANDDPALLTEITWALHMYAILQQLGDLAVAMETFGDLMMDAAELFPGGGQALAAGRLVATATAFIASDLPDIAAELIKNPRELLSRVWDEAKSILSAGKLLDYVLLGNYSLNTLIHKPRASGARRPTKTTSRRMIRLLHKLQTLAQSVGRVLARTTDAVQDKRQEVEHFVQGHPGAVRAVRMVADYYLVIAAIADQLSQIQDRDEILQAFTNPEDLGRGINEAIARIGDVELPAEILPLAELIDTLIDVIGHRLGGKYRLGVHILMKLLDAIGAREEIVNGIRDVLVDAGLKTDVVFPQWKEEVIPKIGKYFLYAQTQIRDSLDAAFSAFGIPLKLETPKANVRASGSEFPDPPADLPAGVPEGQPLLDETMRERMSARAGGGALGTAQAIGLLRTLPTEPGVPLTPRVRAQAEARFGQDFSHVRLHRGGEAARLAREAGARALTSGSHIVMAESGERDTRTLYHELAHVIQQTGARRPGDGGGARAPRPGRPGRGLRWNPNSEARADAASAAALRGNARNLPLGGPNEGWQPSFIDMLGQRFLHQLTDISALEAEVESIDRPAGGAHVRLIGRDVRAAVKHVADNLRTHFRPGANALHVPAGTYSSEAQAISSHLLNNHGDIAAAVEPIAIRASFEAERGKKGKPARMALDVDDFKRRLERYIFGKTGILLDLLAETSGHGRSKTFRNPHSPFKKATVKFVFLAPIHGNSPLWEHALKYRSRFGGPKEVIKEGERSQWRVQIRAVLRDLGPSSSIWIGNEYRLSAKVFAAAEELTKLQQKGGMGGTLPHSALPTVNAYVDPKGMPDHDFGNVRLHLGSYEQKKSGEQKGKERESHHITQYLLAEYFHNGPTGEPEKESDRMGFPLLRKFRSRNPYGAPMREVSGVPQSYGKLQIAAIEMNRGGKMPTILLARPTHRRANLHLTPVADDFDDTSTATQAAAMNRLYKKRLPPTQEHIEREVASGNRPYSDWEKYVKEHSDYTSTISKAMQQSYADMRDYMQKQLKAGLRSIERDYYNDLYRAANPGTRSTQPLTTGHMEKVWRDAVSHNNENMKRYGWEG